jgi:hypothetical protein
MSGIVQNSYHDSSDSSQDEEVEQDDDDESSDIPLLIIKWNHSPSFQLPEECANLARTSHHHLPV